MKKIQTIIATTIVGAVFALGSLTIKAQDSDNDAFLAKQSNITMAEAIVIATKTVPGTAVKAEFEKEKGQTFWEVEVLANNQQTMELEVDANNGNILNQKLNKVDNEHNHEEREYEEDHEDIEDQ